MSDKDTLSQRGIGNEYNRNLINDEFNRNDYVGDACGGEAVYILYHRVHRV